MPAENTPKNENPIDGIISTISEPAKTPGTGAPGTGAAKSDAIDSGAESPKNAAGIAGNLLDSRRNERAEKRGRHPKGCVCGNCKQSQKSSVSLASPKTGKQSIAVIPPVSEIDRQIARDAIRAATHLMDSFSVLCVVTVAKKKGADKITIDDATDKSVMPKETREGLATTGAAVLEKYQMVKLAPEISCGLYITTWLTSLIMTLISLSRIPDKDETLAQN